MKATIAARNVVPFWVVGHLGKKVQLVKEHHEWNRTYEVGSTAKLDGVTTDEDGSIWAVVTFDVDRDPSYLLHVDFDCIGLPSHDSGDTLREVCSRIPGRAGEIAHLWTKGVDPKARVSRNTYYRYRRELIGYGIDIARPYASAN